MDYEYTSSQGSLSSASHVNALGLFSPGRNGTELSLFWCSQVSALLLKLSSAACTRNVKAEESLNSSPICLKIAVEAQQMTSESQKSVCSALFSQPVFAAQSEELYIQTC